MIFAIAIFVPSQLKHIGSCCSDLLMTRVTLCPTVYHATIGENCFRVCCDIRRHMRLHSLMTNLRIPGREGIFTAHVVSSFQWGHNRIIGHSLFKGILKNAPKSGGCFRLTQSLRLIVIV
ncbi:hypothetical protein AVEN_39547-1 [Araneus ventricosus]|uniref:Uncharacterized protein n=1 Tax=Araneus ventricosus TaxID=182803 RepID=A0A4Y2LM65_ARAVE|nr:hypothetical protein AVEN_39547-1 [Araneus ventricosus]